MRRAPWSSCGPRCQWGVPWGYPNGWMIYKGKSYENPNLNWMMTGATPVYGHPHVVWWSFLAVVIGIGCGDQIGQWVSPGPGNRQWVEWGTSLSSSIWTYMDAFELVPTSSPEVAKRNRPETTRVQGLWPLFDIETMCLRAHLRTQKPQIVQVRAAANLFIFRAVAVLSIYRKPAEV